MRKDLVAFIALGFSLAFASTGASICNFRTNCEVTANRRKGATR
jgi:hypothetical protein